MALYLGLDTSNYTTSAALYDPAKGKIWQQKKLLPVKPGEKGLRQSDAVFHHTVQLPEVFSALDITGRDIAGIGVSTRPCSAEGSYMPCFLCGEGAAVMLGKLSGAPVYRTSHQIGHILAALYSADSMHFLRSRFLAFHVSGGTTDCVLCEPDAGEMLRVTPVSSSLDLKAGQAVDRVGILLGLSFPCGKALEQLAFRSRKTFRYKPTMKGMDCCLSGLENQCAKLLENGEDPCDIAAFCLYAISETVLEMTKRAMAETGQLPVVYAGGVMSDLWIRDRLKQTEGSVFAQPEFSCDNAAGTAVYAAWREEGGKWPF